MLDFRPPAVARPRVLRVLATTRTSCSGLNGGMGLIMAYNARRWGRTHEVAFHERDAPERAVSVVAHLLSELKCAWDGASARQPARSPNATAPHFARTGRPATTACEPGIAIRVRPTNTPPLDVRETGPERAARAWPLIAGLPIWAGSDRDSALEETNVGAGRLRARARA